MLVIGGIVKGTLNDYMDRSIGVGADFILQQSGSSVFYAFSQAALPIKLADKIREEKGIATVVPVLAKFSAADFGLVFGVDLASYNQLSGHLQVVAGRGEMEGDEAIVDELYAKSHNLGVGSTLNILNHKFMLVGICRPGAVVRVFVPLKTLQEMNGSPDKVTIMFIKAADGTNVQQIFEDLRAQFPGYGLLRASETSLLLADTRIPGLREFSFTIVLVSMLLSFMVILLAMYTTIFERTREIGILKSLGASRGFILGIILKESVMISCLGVLFGTGVSEIIRHIIVSSVPTLQIAMSWTEVLRGCALGLAGGTLGALYPAYKAARMDPVQALSYE
jgi:putative ABC transport system permease protein